VDGASTVTKRVQLGQLGALTKLAEGGQGTVFEAPRVRAGSAGKGVYKQYKDVVLRVLQKPHLQALVDLPDRLAASDATLLADRVAWPLAVVFDTGQLTGFVMPRVPEAFYVDLRLPSGRKRSLGQLQHLLNSERWLADRDLAVTDLIRLQLIRDVAFSLALFHRIGLTVGDLSAKNLLFSLDGEPRCFFLDCDAMRLRGGSALPQYETPDWDVAAISNEELGTPASDVYKLGLLAVRLFSGDQTSRNPSTASRLPANLVPLVRQSLDPKAGTRPVAHQWLAPLAKAIAAQTPRNAPALPPKPPGSGWHTNARVRQSYCNAHGDPGCTRCVSNPKRPTQPTSSQAAPKAKPTTNQTRTITAPSSATAAAQTPSWTSHASSGGIDGEEFLPHLARFAVIGGLMIASLYVIVGLLWWMHAARRTGFRARDTLIGPVLLLPLALWPIQIAWRYTAQTMYWTPRPDHESKPLFQAP
jgi:hypothetical protein